MSAEFVRAEVPDGNANRGPRAAELKNSFGRGKKETNKGPSRDGSAVCWPSGRRGAGRTAHNGGWLAARNRDEGRYGAQRIRLFRKLKTEAKCGAMVSTALGGERIRTKRLIAPKKRHQSVARG